MDLHASRLILVTGKGGTGKSSVSAALGILASKGGRRTLIVEVDSQKSAMKDIFEIEPAYEPAEVQSNLFVANLHWLENLSDWVGQVLPGGRVVRMVLNNSLIQTFLKVAPGNRETVALSKIGWLLDDFDLVIVDLPASGHALNMLEAPHTMVGLFSSGPIRSEGLRALDMLKADTSHLIFVGLAEEMVVNETIETFQKVHELLPSLTIDGVILNRATTESLSCDEQELLSFLSQKENSPELEELFWAGRWVSALEDATRNAQKRLKTELKTKVSLVPRLSQSGGAKELVSRMADILSQKSVLEGPS